MQSQRPKGPQGRRNDRHKPSSSVPREVTALSRSKPILRVKNIHPDLNGEDLSNLFDGVAPVEFVKFDPRKDDVAYMCFQYDHNKNNSIAISRFDGRKAMGQNLVVESATSLADRIIIPSRGVQKGPRNQVPGGKGHNAPKRQPKPQKKSIDTLDEELSAYMSGKSEEELKKESKVNKLDDEMDNYWKNDNNNEPNPGEGSHVENGNENSANQPEDAADAMKLD